MFSHPIRKLIFLSAAGWLVRRSVNKMGGPKKILSSITGRPAARRARTKA